jgi:hypothetical protein
MAALRQVTFHFPTDTQIRYVERRPRRGERIRGLDGDVYIVARTEPGCPGEVARCVTPLEYAREVRRAGGPILERAREQGERAIELRARAVRAARRADLVSRRFSGRG